MRLFILAFGLTLTFVSALLLWKRQNDVPQYIAFLSNRDGNSEVFIMKPDGSNLKQLTHANSPSNDHGHCWFSWAEQGLDIYAKFGNSYEPGDFYCYHGGGEVSQLNIDGKILERNADENYIRAAKSPNGKWYITKESLPKQNAPYYAGIYRTDKRTGEKEFLASLEHWLYSDVRWSSNGDWIVFIDFATNDNTNKLYRMRPDGSDLQLLTNSSCDIFSISPNSNWLYFVQNDDEDKGDCSTVYRVKLDEPNFDSTKELVVSLPVTMDYEAENFIWSPDGNSIASWDFYGKFFVISLRTKKAIYIADSLINYEYRSISWSPDSQWLAFASCEENDVSCHIYRVRQDSTGLEQLTFGNHQDIRPQYAPLADFLWHGALSLGMGLFCLMVGSFRLPCYPQKIGNYYRSVR